jgi:hypothetical protein
MRRLIYSQLPLPLGTLPRFDGITRPPQTWGTQCRGDVKTAKSLLEGVAAGAFMREAVGQSQPTQSPK